MKRAHENSNSIINIPYEEVVDAIVEDIDLKLVCDHGRRKHQCKDCGTGRYKQ